KGRDALRKAQRRPAVSLNASMSDRGGAFVDLLEIDLPDASAGLEAEDRSRLVQDAISALSPRLREILLLAYFQKLSYAQISEEFGIPLGTVKSRLHAAVAAFARRWAELQAELADNAADEDDGAKSAPQSELG
ncbi:MAG: sigma-70 family RNA polymerase sigma factor, partial [Phycisphaerales bacterium]|nr:sigma-70 family RNA polymerase sigma factor [Phycisphaerales bacterium]